MNDVVAASGERKISVWERDTWARDTPSNLTSGLASYPDQRGLGTRLLVVSLWRRVWFGVALDLAKFVSLSLQVQASGESTDLVRYFSFLLCLDINWACITNFTWSQQSLWLKLKHVNDYLASTVMNFWARCRTSHWHCGSYTEIVSMANLQVCETNLEQKG